MNNAVFVSMLPMMVIELVDVDIVETAWCVLVIQKCVVDVDSVVATDVVAATHLMLIELLFLVELLVVLQYA
ncbi:hypothetical protein DPMN_050389 [Dreissena polymorpha]|uniref:Uncharacterized protein n=1 Tax=Dreissena polymorpha TaxID=45954 RepID=A0A9D4HM92_DREPO|nr:hypothetical protein DPMN_050389 [Dreissena polymorpha]